MHASPSTILEFMTPNLDITSERVKSHLQKYRLNRQKSQNEFMQNYDCALEGYQTRMGQSLADGEEENTEEQGSWGEVVSAAQKNPKRTACHFRGFCSVTHTHIHRPSRRQGGRVGRYHSYVYVLRARGRVDTSISRYLSLHYLSTRLSTT